MFIYKICCAHHSFAGHPIRSPRGPPRCQPSLEAGQPELHQAWEEYNFKMTSQMMKFPTATKCWLKKSLLSLTCEF